LSWRSGISGAHTDSNWPGPALSAARPGTGMSGSACSAAHAAGECTWCAPMAAESMRSDVCMTPRQARRVSYTIRPMNTGRAKTGLLLSLPKAAAEIGVDVRTVRTAIAEGQLPARQIGRRLMIPRRAIERLVEPE